MTNAENTIHLYGTLASDPTPEIAFMNNTFFIAVTNTDQGGSQITRWIRCVDRQGASPAARKGDLVHLSGSFADHTYKQRYGTPTTRAFLVDELHILNKQRPRHDYGDDEAELAFTAGMPPVLNAHREAAL